MKQNAIVLTHGYLKTINAKTCHGLLRYSSRFSIKGVIDQEFAGQDAGMVMDGKELGVQVYPSVSAFFEEAGNKVDCLIIGVATHGGLLPESFVGEIKIAIENGCSVVNGLHDYLSDHKDISSLAAQKGVELTDIRKPKNIRSMNFWSGEIYNVNAAVVAVLGVDCALGKRTTSGLIYEMCNRKGMKTEMIYTGQTGWMQGYKHGFIFDSTLNDYISGEIEKSIVTCDKEENPDLILLEGQSSLRNPSGPGGSEFLVSGNAKGVILQVAPERIYFEGYEDLHLILPSAAEEIELINRYGSEVIAVTLYNTKMKPEALERQRMVMEKELEIPVIAPLQNGVEDLYDEIVDYISRYRDSE
jgi:uncharacterized NAD-dependent epimerase/dehydratase family protein